MIRKIIKINQAKCNGCGACAEACHEGAIEMINGKAHLTREDYCDGLGDCLPACPMDAISFEEREAPAYNEAAVLAAKKKKAPCACQGSVSKSLLREKTEAVTNGAGIQSRLSQWPIQIKLAPTSAPYFDGAELLIAADCTAYAYGNFHADFINDRITLIGCPKLDAVDYAEKLTAILSQNDIKSITVARMQVPCCGGLEGAVKRAVIASKKIIPLRVAVISTDGKIIK